MTFEIDIDNTLCSPISRSNASSEIEGCLPNLFMVDLVNDLYDRGNVILINTHRQKKYCGKLTKEWLEKYKVKYTKIFFNKLKADLRIDDKALPPYKYLKAKMVEEYAEQIKHWDFNKGSFVSKKRKKK